MCICICIQLLVSVYTFFVIKNMSTRVTSAVFVSGCLYVFLVITATTLNIERLHVNNSDLYTKMVIRGPVDMAVVLLMSTSWAPMLSRVKSWTSMRMWCHIPVDWLWNLASRNIACSEWNRQYKRNNNFWSIYS